MIRTYRKIPITIKAVQYDGDNLEEIREWLGSNLKTSEHHDPVIVTLEGNMMIGQGDYIVQGTKGEFYPVKPDIFDQIYELEDV